jgi:signal transduction histidine kinase
MWLSSDPPNLGEVRSAVDSIAQQGTRASDIVRRIRGMFTKAAPERAKVALNVVIREACSLVQVQASRSAVSLRIELADDLPFVVGDPLQLQQVVVNLVLNGIEAASAVTDRSRRLTVTSARTGASEVLVAVRDSGIGIDPKDEKRIFDAFFTTKAQGMGMGLSICQSIIEAHGGRLWANANDDYGATLQFTLPIDNGSTP